MLFTFFAEATAGAVRSVVDRENLVRKIHFPRLVIPTSVVLLSLFNLGMNLIVVLLFAVGDGVTPMLSWLELPLIITMIVIFSLGLAMLLSAMFVHFRDIQPIWEVVSQILFYASPVIISIETIKKELDPTWLHIYMLNPLAVILQQFRHAMITNATPSAGAVLGSWTEPPGCACDRRGDLRRRLHRVPSRGRENRREPVRWTPVSVGGLEMTEQEQSEVQQLRAR